MEEYFRKSIGKSLSTTDLLALGRNHLANERTLLAYIRTFLSFIVAGVSLIQFFDHRTFILLGYLFISLSFILLFVGFFRFYKIRRSIDRLEKAASDK